MFMQFQINEYTFLQQFENFLRRRFGYMSQFKKNTF